MSTLSYTFIGGAAGDNANQSVSSAGDVDGDGRDDLIIGARYADGGGSDTGESYLITAADLAAADAADGTVDGNINLGLVGGVNSDNSLDVSVDDTGAGTATQAGLGTSTLTSVEDFVANEATGETDVITITDSGSAFTTADIVDVDTGAQDGTTSGSFTPVATGVPIAFGPSEALSYDQIIAGIDDRTYPGGGAFEITGGDETGAVGGISFENFEQINFGVMCFAQGTLIKTIKGEVPIEDLRQGDRVLTFDCGYQPISWIGGRSLGQTELEQNPKLRPIRIQAGALGPNLPEQDLIVSPQHRILIKSVIAVRMFDTAEVLVPANKLLTLPGIDIEWDVDSVDYFHMLFEHHQIVFSNGSPTESLFTGPEALKAVSAEARAEIEALFPHIFYPDFVPVPARLIPEKGKQMKILAQRLTKNNKPAQESLINTDRKRDLT
jgi:hypothetical protein